MVCRFEDEVVGDPQLVAAVLGPPDETGVLLLPLWGQIERRELRPTVVLGVLAAMGKKQQVGTSDDYDSGG